MWKPLLIKQETEYQLIGLFFSMSLFLVFWGNCHEMASFRQKGCSLVRGVQYKPKGVYMSGGVN